MSARRRTGKMSSTKSMLIILLTIIIAGISIAIILNFVSGSGEISLKEGQDYDISHIEGNKYQVIDDTGNVIELNKVTPELYKDRRGRSYRFVSGSPYKYMGTK